ncbi:MAG: trypsin-like peptidase domain-containing protein [Pseudomonadota bacterium]
MANHFLTKSSISLDQCLEFGGGLAIEAYPALRALLEAKAGPAAARLFAEPLLSRGNDSAAPSVSWYTDIEGKGVPYHRLSDVDQAALSADLSRSLREIRALLDDADDGELVAAALHLSDPGDVLSVEGRPVLINWGMVAKDMARDPGTRRTHYAQTLGRFLPLGAAPPLTQGERAAWQDARPTQSSSAPAGESAAGAAAVAGAGAGAAAATVAQADPARAPVAAPERRRMPLSAWLPLLLLLLAAGGALAWLLIPGNRLFPVLTSEQAVTDEAALAAAEGINRSLEERLAILESSLEGAVCRDDGTLLMPDGYTIEGLLPPNPNDPADLPGAIREASPRSILPPDPERVQVEDSTQPNGTAELVAHIEARTAIVVAATNNGALSSGTGFFVGPDLLMTNHHVIAGAATGQIYITNKALGQLHTAQVLKSAGPFQATGKDFALLRVDGVNQPAFDILNTSESQKLQSVVAAGYPADLLQSDAQFQALRRGDFTAVPDLAMTDGTVSTEQMVNTARMIAHSAPISQGNSGGPLIDMCGRVVGVNTFIREGSARTLNFALASGDMMGFLDGTPALPRTVRNTCVPQIARPTGVQRAALEPEPEADGSNDGVLPPLSSGAD